MLKTILFMLLATTMLAAAPAGAGTKRTTIHGWTITCEHDAIHDGLHCSATKEGLLLFRHGGLRHFAIMLYSSQEEYPGSGEYIRIDQGPVWMTVDEAFRGQEASALAAAMRKGAIAHTRLYTWPEHEAITRTVDLTGINAVLNYLEKATH